MGSSQLDKGLRTGSTKGLQSLTEKGLQALRADTRRDLLVRDRRGLIVRLEPAGSRTRKVLRYRFKRAGRQHVVRLGEYGEPPALNVRDIHSLHGQCERAARSGGDPRAIVEAFWQERLPPELVQGPTVLDVIEEFLRVAARTRKRPEQARYLLAHYVAPKVGHRAAADISKRDLVELFDGIVDAGSPVVANRVYSTLKQAFMVAADRDLIAAVPPFPRHKPGGAEKVRTRVLSNAEIKALWNGLDDLSLPVERRTKITRPLALALKLQLVTAQRRGEIAGARWADVESYDTERKQGRRTVTETRHRWRIVETKSNRTHVVPLSPLAWQLLTELRGLTGKHEYWLPSQRGGDAPRDRERSIARVARVVRDTLEMQEWRPHDLRRTARTALARLGVAEAVAERVINHAPNNPMVVVYDQHNYLGEACEALDLWAAELERLVEAT